MSMRRPGEQVTRAFGGGDPAQCEMFLNHESRYGWQLVSVSEGPPWNRNSWFTLHREPGAVTDGMSETGWPLRRWMYRVIGRRQDLVDRGEATRIVKLIEDGWRVAAVLKAPPWNDRPVTFLTKHDVDVIEVVRPEDPPQKRQVTLAKIRPGGGYDIEVVDADRPEEVGPTVGAEEGGDA